MSSTYKACRQPPVIDCRKKHNNRQGKRKETVVTPREETYKKVKIRYTGEQELSLTRPQVKPGRSNQEGFRRQTPDAARPSTFRFLFVVAGAAWSRPLCDGRAIRAASTSRLISSTTRWYDGNTDSLYGPSLRQRQRQGLPLPDEIKILVRLRRLDPHGPSCVPHSTTTAMYYTKRKSKSVF